MAGAPILQGRGVSRWFGGVRALLEVDLDLQPGEILGLIGPNGAGKTTLINVVSGALRPSAGTVAFRGRPIHHLAPHRIAELGIARSFQVSRAFLGMTVEENVLVGAIFGRAEDGGARRAREERLRAVDHILELIGLAGRRHDLVQALNVPDRKRVDLGRVLAMQPEVLLLDELMAGLNPSDMEGLLALVREINRQGASLIVIEHVMRVIVDLCDRVMVLHHGQKIADGPPHQVMEDALVLKAYLGPRFREKIAAAEGAKA